jgi:hypothetical protein
MVMRKLLQLTVLPEVMVSVFKFKSAPLVPTVPVAATVVLSDFTSAKYPAVPVFPAVPEVIAFAVAVTVPADATDAGNAVAENVIVASRVPVTAPFSAGCAPEYTLMNPEFSKAVNAFTVAIPLASYTVGLFAIACSYRGQPQAARAGDHGLLRGAVTGVTDVIGHAKKSLPGECRTG